MNAQNTEKKIWNLCTILRDDGVPNHQYIMELTYILFLKILEVSGEEIQLLKVIESSFKKRLHEYATNRNKSVNELTESEKSGLKNSIDSYSWMCLAKLHGVELKKYYRSILAELGKISFSKIADIYANAVSHIEEPKNLEKVISEINKFDWSEMRKGDFGDFYEYLLSINVKNWKSGVGQYFTPRVLTDVMTELIEPKFGERCFDPACGTFGFMISAYQHMMSSKDLSSLTDEEEKDIQNAFNGIELDENIHRIALVNAYLHNVPANIYCENTLASEAKRFKEFDVILTNPPFDNNVENGNFFRDDISFQKTGKQFKFLQIIYRSLKKSGNARCAVLVPDGVLFSSGYGNDVRRELMNFCDVHTIIRLPMGVFEITKIATSILFFTRGKTEKGNTKEIAFYDMRTGNSFSRTRLLKKTDFDEFIEGFKNPLKRTSKRWTKYTREEIEEKYDDCLDLGLIEESSVVGSDGLPDPITAGEEAIANLEEAVDLLKDVVRELKVLSSEK